MNNTIIRFANAKPRVKLEGRMLCALSLAKWHSGVTHTLAPPPLPPQQAQGAGVKLTKKVGSGVLFCLIYNKKQQ